MGKEVERLLDASILQRDLLLLAGDGGRYSETFCNFPLMMRHSIHCSFSLAFTFLHPNILVKRFPTHQALLLASCTYLARLCSIEREEDVVHLPLTASSTVRCLSA